MRKHLPLKPTKNLRLTTETVRQLDQAELEAVNGGAIVPYSYVCSMRRC